MNDKNNGVYIYSLVLWGHLIVDCIAIMHLCSAGPSGNVSNNSLLLLFPIFPEGSNTELSTQATAAVLYLLGAVHIALSLWMLVERMLLISPYLIDELRAHW